MRVLITNDDGVDAPGIRALYRELGTFADVVVAAPSGERSAVGHAISVYGDVKVVRRADAEGCRIFAIDGTPADCVKLALTVLMKDAPPDIVISGINRGMNAGTSVLYSGTVSAALEGAMMGYPAIAVSLAVLALFKGTPLVGPDDPPAAGDDAASSRLARRTEDYAVAARFAARLARRVVERGLPPGVMLNANVPFVPEEDIRGAVVARMGHAIFIDDFQVVHETDDATVFRNIGDQLVPSGAGETYDDHLLAQNYISITPLHYDLTHHASLADLADWVAGDGIHVTPDQRVSGCNPRRSSTDS